MNKATTQPEWKLVAQLGDENPLDHGGYWIFIDTTGQYQPEGEYLIAPEGDEKTYEAFRFPLDLCYLTNGILSDNRYHLDHAAWFATPEGRRAERPQDTTYLSDIAIFAGITVAELTGLLCSPDYISRALAYRDIGAYHGFDNLDSYPLRMTEREARIRYCRLLYGWTRKLGFRRP